MKFSKIFGSIVLFGLTFMSCQSEYTRTVNREAKKGAVKDSLILGMSLGDTKQEFFDKCWQLNNKGLVSQGPNNQSVQYILSSKGTDKNLTAINMLFYGNFDKHDTMIGLDMEFFYKAWAPWNDQYMGEKLLPVLKDTLMNWFPGNEFIPVKVDKIDKETYVKVDGNRQIVAYVKDQKEVIVKIEDLKFKYPEKFK